MQREYRTHEGYLLLADISGYTQFLTGTELEHAQAIVRELTTLVHERLVPPMHFHVDAENMSVTAGGAALCREVAAAANALGLSCPPMDSHDRVADVVETSGNRQPARRFLLGVKATLPGGHHATFGSAAMKDVAGLDAKRLVAGGGGKFGRVERVTLKAIPCRD